MVYEVYAGGIHAVQARLDIDTRLDGHYDLVLTAKTRGFLGSIVPWEGKFESHGWVLDGNEYRPELHKSTTAAGDEGEIKEYSYTRDRKFISLITTEQGKSPVQKDLEEALTQGTTDALTATLQVLQTVANGQPCAGSSEVFDGERRFEQIFRDQGTAQLENSKYNIFRGAAAECTVEIIPVSGKWHAKPRGWLSIQEQGRAKGTMPTVWMAKLDVKGPAVPVKIRVKTDYGVLFMHLAEYRSGEQVVVAEKRVLD